MSFNNPYSSPARATTDAAVAAVTPGGNNDDGGIGGNVDVANEVAAAVAAFETTFPNSPDNWVVRVPHGSTLTKSLGTLSLRCTKPNPIGSSMAVWKSRNLGNFAPNPVYEVDSDLADDPDDDFLGAINGDETAETLLLTPGPKYLWGSFLSNHFGLSTFETFSNLFMSTEANLVDANHQLAANASLSKSPHTFIGCVKPIVNHKLSVRNQANIPFCIIKNGVRTFNNLFWRKHVNSRDVRAGKTHWMNLGFEIPQALLHEDLVAAHNAGKEQLMNHGASVIGTEGQFVCMQLYGGYAWSFVNLMSCPIVHLALCNGWSPVILFKNFGMQKKQV